MMEKDKTEARHKRHRRVRKKIHGTREKPRICVYRSLKHMYAQLVDDVEGRTLLTLSTLHKDVREKLNGSMKKSEKSRILGLVFAEKAKQIGVEKVVFDTAGYRYHGRVRTLAEGAREGGLIF
ncbi:50S ribosomal protein L18 [candidate division TA06 bacterium DG_26]|uniref:Large ribosomal subunit protein uL18 n=1 Tax=candidate division TA06 bacterium DG_26 TaxID=1703771 RepID=A0A0S7WLB0_UNCT6|nr:MAG: 50S ribosomal protein L18 [candidate division TA06 bacterium DG_26]